MSDATRQPGGIPVERDRQAPGTGGGTALGTDRAGTADPVPGTPAGTTPDPRPRSTAAPAAPAAHGPTLLPDEECDRLGQRLQHAVADFVDAPRASVEEADRLLEEITARLTDAVTHRRRTLRTSWQDTGGDDRATSTDTEQLRLALRDYRELADRLMRL
ncbi:hypothetical protein [Streptomyces pactum]|uniref:Uncharacterized protein n=1 Tax=Streptomyces pactum TaxID=68249 RepID=A0A1S6JDL8_9ACTN|nr:hypothetical protein [Streptomyces pactum]AQS69823.1 hypothetical protein B1H29_25695 [Streptomyces pactum]